jgi:hypothetical protein
MQQRRRVRPQELFLRGAWCVAPIERIGKGAAQSVGDGSQALRAFGMSRAGIVLKTGWVCVDVHVELGNPARTEVQIFRRSWFHNTSPCPLARASTRDSTNSRSDSRLR